jgi:hypothetical protein
MNYCQCDSNTPRVEKKFSQLERDFDSQIKEIKRLEYALKRANPQKYKDMSIDYYFKQNAKLGDQGRPKGIVPEKSFEMILAGKNFQD